MEPRQYEVVATGTFPYTGPKGGIVTEGSGAKRTVIYCIVPRDLEGKLHERLRQHFRADSSVEVIVERRADERRAGEDRRANGATPRQARERRKIRHSGGRRVGDRRAMLLPLTREVPLPRNARRFAERLVFVERLEPAGEQAEDADSARLVTQIQLGQRELFAELYLRYFDRVYSYLRILLNDNHEAEDVTQQVFMKAFEALPRYEVRAGKPFRAWLFTIVRNDALGHLKKHSRLEVTDPAEVGRRREAHDSEEEPSITLDWISDSDLQLFIERLPLAQRQVLMMRYMLDLPHAEIAAILDRTPNEVRKLQQRATRFLNDRLTALGRAPRHGDRITWQRRVTQVRVLRERRYALMR
jgi:RNA polymerase sigma-70 factor (ECF subfamily)